VISFKAYYLTEAQDIKQVVKKQPVRNKDAKITKALNTLQLALDVAGIIPEPFTEITANSVNTVISLLRAAAAKTPNKRKKHIINAGLSAIAIIPMAGVIKVLKLRKAPVLAKKAIQIGRAAKAAHELQGIRSGYKLAKVAQKSVPVLKHVMPSVERPA